MVFDGLAAFRNLEPLTFFDAVLTSTFVCLLYCSILVFYRLFLHPLSRIPGPKLAGATYWFEYYYDVTKQGSYLWKIVELHKQYGPVVRVGPNEVHISDPAFYQEIYHSKAYKTDRDTWYNLEFLGQAVSFTRDHDLHAQRRHALGSYFSMQSIRELEPRIVGVIEIMLDRLEQERKAGSVINLYDLFAAVANDIVSEYAFGKDGSMGMISKPDYNKDWNNSVHDFMQSNPFLRQFKGFLKLMMVTPGWLVLKINPAMLQQFNWQNKVLTQVKQVLELEKLGDKEVSVIYDLAHSDLPPTERSAQRLQDESLLLSGAGSETTAQCLTRTAFRVLDNPTVLKRLLHELKEAVPDPKVIPALSELKKLPYLNAVIEEGFRLAFPVLSRSPRVFQDHTLQYGQHVIPPGAAVSQSPYMVQSNPEIFPEPFVYKPERWLDNKALQRYQVAFSKGRRSCLGMNLAYAETYLALAMMFRRFDLELYQTTVEDVTIKHDFFVSMARLDSAGVRVKALRTLQ